MKRIYLFGKILLLAMFMTFVNQSCTDLDEELYDAVTPDQFFQDQDQFIAALGAAYTRMYSYSSNSHLSVQCVATDEMAVPTRGQDWDDGGHWRRLHLHSWNYEDSQPSGVWGDAFGGVNTCNRLIFQFEQLVEQGKAEPELAEGFISELKVLRAFFYWQLIDVYGNVPIVTSFADAPDNPPTETRAKVFEFITSELSQNVPKLTKDVGGDAYARVNYWTGKVLEAKMYLNAKVYLDKGSYDVADLNKAIAACKEIIDIGKFSLEANYFANFNVANEGSKEFIFTIPYDQVFATGFNYNMRSLHYGSQDTYNLTAQPWNGFCTLGEFYDSYDDADLRKGQPGTKEGPYTGRGNFIAGYQFKSNGDPVVDDGFEKEESVTENNPWFDPDGDHLNFGNIGFDVPMVNELGPQALRQSGARIGKFEYAPGSTPDMSNDFAVFRYADVLLMQAEAYWRKSGSSTDADALALVNDVRSTHGGAAIGLLTSLDGVVSFHVRDADGNPIANPQITPGGELLNERGREMFAEHARRKDLIRWGLFTQVDQWAPKTRVVGDAVETGAHTILMPIPRGQMDSNPALKQNPGYTGAQ